MSTTRIKKLVKSQEQIRIEIQNVNKEFKIELTLDVNFALGKLSEVPQEKIKKLKHYEPMPTIQEEPVKEEVRLKR